MPQSSNNKRTLWRTRCREALAAHIHDRLNITIPADQVRWQPPPEDGYAWSVAPPKADLLNTSLSSGNLTYYMTICEEIGHSLEAVLPQTLRRQEDLDASQGQQTDRSSRDDGSFTAKIRDLENSNRSLRLELDRTHVDLEKCSGETRGLHDIIDKLQDEMARAVSQAAQLESDLAQARKCTGAILHLVQAHNQQGSWATPEEMTGYEQLGNFEPVAPELGDP